MADTLINAAELAKRYRISKREAARVISMVNAELKESGLYVVKARPPKAPLSKVKSKLNMK